MPNICNTYPHLTVCAASQTSKHVEDSELLPRFACRTEKKSQGGKAGLRLFLCLHLGNTHDRRRSNGNKPINVFRNRKRGETRLLPSSNSRNDSSINSTHRVYVFESCEISSFRRSRALTLSASSFSEAFLFASASAFSAAFFSASSITES